MKDTDFDKGRLAELIGNWFSSRVSAKGIYVYLRDGMDMDDASFQPIYQALLHGMCFDTMSTAAIAADLGDAPGSDTPQRMKDLARLAVANCFECEEAAPVSPSKAEPKPASIGSFSRAEVFTPDYMLTFSDAGLALAVMEGMAEERKIADVVETGTPFSKWVKDNLDGLLSCEKTADLPARLEKFKGMVRAMLMGRSYIFEEGKRPYPGHPTRLAFEAQRSGRSDIGSRHMRMEILRRIRDIKLPEGGGGEND